MHTCIVVQEAIEKVIENAQKFAKNLLGTLPNTKSEKWFHKIALDQTCDLINRFEIYIVEYERERVG